MAVVAARLARDWIASPHLRLPILVAKLWPTNSARGECTTFLFMVIVFLLQITVRITILLQFQGSYLNWADIEFTPASL